MVAQRIAPIHSCLTFLYALECLSLAFGSDQNGFVAGGSPPDPVMYFMELSDLLDLETVKTMAGERSFARGAEYYSRGLVSKLKASSSRVAAVVQGNQDYKVTLSALDDTVEFLCICPICQDGNFCKHCVAVGICWLSEPSQSDLGDAGAIASYLAGLDQSELIRMLLDQAAEDDRFARSLLLRAQKAQGKQPNFRKFRQRIDRTVKSRGFMEYEEERSYTSDVLEVADEIEELVDLGYAIEAIELTEHTIAKFEKAMYEMDDSDGCASQVVTRLLEIHLAACNAARPNPVDLARRLFAWELKSDGDSFCGIVESYDAVLGEAGIAAFRALADEEWKRVPARVPGTSGQSRESHFRITSIMQSLAQRSGDVDELVSVMQRDLSLPYHYLRIAEIFKEAGRPEESMNWALRSLATFPNAADDRLVEFIARDYHESGRHAEAMDLIWENYNHNPSVRGFEKVREHAFMADAWPTWRERTIERIWRQVTERERNGATRWSKPDRSDLVEVLLVDDDPERAWKEAVAGGCSTSLWLKLAKSREEQNPSDAISVYQAHVKKLLVNADNRVYADSVMYLKSISRLMKRLNRSAEFRSELAALRLEHKRKRNLMQLLDQTNWDV